MIDDNGTDVQRAALDKLSPCRKCGKAPSWFRRVVNRGSDPVAVFCDNARCAADGVEVVGRTPNEAARKWNRVNDKAPDA